MLITMKNIFLLFLIITFSTYSLAGEIRNCKQRDDYKSAVSSLKKISYNKYEDSLTLTKAKQEHQAVLSVAESCGLSEKNLTKLKRRINRIAKKRYRKLARLLVKKVKYVSDFRSPRSEIDEIKAVEEELGLSEFHFLPETKEKRLLETGIVYEGLRSKSCTEVNNTTPVLSKPRDQDSVGWCYAFSAADLLSHKLNKKISAVHLATLYNHNDFWTNLRRNITPVVAITELAGQGRVQVDKELGEITLRERVRSESSIEGGFTGNAIRHGLQHGICTEHEIPSNYSIERNIFELERLVANYREISVPLRAGECNSTSQEEIYSYVVDGTRVNLKNDYFGEHPQNDLLQEMFPSLDFETFFEVINQTNRQNAYQQLLAASCKEEVAITDNINVHEVTARGKDFSDTLDQQLENGNVAEIGYHAGVLYNPDMPNRSSGLHSALILGRRFNAETNKCEYLLRNSWGEGSLYHSSYDTEIMKDTAWISEEALGKSGIDITYIE